MHTRSTSHRPYARRLFALSVILVCMASAITASAQPRPVSATARQAPTTPEVIDQAFARGEISSDQRLLYLIYAVSDFGKLPVQFLGRAGWSATIAVREINQARQALASGRSTFSPQLRAALQPVGQDLGRLVRRSAPRTRRPDQAERTRPALVELPLAEEARRRLEQHPGSPSTFPPADSRPGPAPEPDG